jgi:bacteriocin-like protein
MRELTTSELACVSGGTGVCTSENSGNDYGGITDTGSVGQELIEIYEGLVEATSHIIERVANAL